MSEDFKKEDFENLENLTKFFEYNLESAEQCEDIYERPSRYNLAANDALLISEFYEKKEKESRKKISKENSNILLSQCLKWLDLSAESNNNSLDYAKQAIKESVEEKNLSLVDLMKFGQKIARTESYLSKAFHKKGLIFCLKAENEESHEKKEKFYGEGLLNFDEGIAHNEISADKAKDLLERYEMDLNEDDKIELNLHIIFAENHIGKIYLEYIKNFPKFYFEKSEKFSFAEKAFENFRQSLLLGNEALNETKLPKKTKKISKLEKHTNFIYLYLGDSKKDMARFCEDFSKRDEFAYDALDYYNKFKEIYQDQPNFANFVQRVKSQEEFIYRVILKIT